MPPSLRSAQSRQNVHSYVHMKASGESGGRSRSQHSQPGLNCSMASSVSLSGSREIRRRVDVDDDSGIVDGDEDHGIAVARDDAARALVAVERRELIAQRARESDRMAALAAREHRRDDGAAAFE